MKDKELRERLFGTGVMGSTGLFGLLEDRIGCVAKFCGVTDGPENRIVECEKCRCLIHAKKEFKGESIIKTRIPYSACPWAVEEYVYTSYYCGRCRPKRGIKK